MEKEGKELGIPTAGGGTEEGGNGGDTDINYPEAEYGRAIYCNAADSGPMRAGHPAARRTGISAVVGAGGDRPGGSALKQAATRSETESEEYSEGGRGRRRQ